MANRILILLFIICIAHESFAQSGAPQKRPPFELKLSVDKDQFYSAPMPESNYIINDSIVQIFPGEKLLIEADVINDKLTNFRVVNEIRNENKTLVIEFEQTTKNKMHEGMNFTIYNPFGKVIHYKAMMNLMKNDRWVRTSVIPVMAELRSIEMWPDLITSLALTGFTLKDE